MVRYIIWLTFLFSIQLSSVLGRNHFYEYYYSRYHHKSHPTTTALSIGISTEIKSGSVSDDDSLKSVEHSSTVDFELAKHKNKTLHSYGYDGYNDNSQYEFALRVGIIAGCSFIFVIGSCCLFFCIRICCRRNAARRGFIIADRNQGLVPPVGPLQPTVDHPPSAIANQYPPQYQDERAQLFPPQYQPQVMQRQYTAVPPTYQPHYSPTAQQDHNPPEAPPPYEFPEKF